MPSILHDFPDAPSPKPARVGREPLTANASGVVRRAQLRREVLVTNAARAVAIALFSVQELRADAVNVEAVEDALARIHASLTHLRRRIEDCGERPDNAS